MIGIFAILTALVAIGHTEDLTGARLGSTCPQQDSWYITFLRDYRNCRAYYQCSNGRAIHRWCPAGLYFNRWLLTCDYPSRSQCFPYRDDAAEVSATVPQDELPSEDFPEVEPAPTEELDTYGPRLGTWCPKVDGRWPTFLIDRFNCGRFYICSNGKQIHQRCPFGLYFNPWKLVCDRRENVRCRTWLP